MFEKLFNKSQPLDSVVPEPGFDEEPVVEPSPPTPSNYQANVTVTFNRSPLYSEHVYTVNVEILKKVGGRLHSAAGLQTHARTEEEGIEKGAAMAKKWIKEQAIIDKPKKLTFDL